MANVNNHLANKRPETLLLQLFPGKQKAGEEGIEPPLTVLETAALPLYYSPVWLLSPEVIIAYSFSYRKCFLYGNTGRLPCQNRKRRVQWRK